MTDLREQVARRLQAVQETEYQRQRKVHPKPWGPASHAAAAANVRMAAADEVIRIAEWARRSTTARVFSDERAIRHFAHTAPLTLPPDDWQP